MKKTGICPKCGSRDIIAPAEVHGSLDRPIKVGTYQNPDALIFKGRQEVPIFAWVCGVCGYLELYASDPNDLKKSGS